MYTKDKDVFILTITGISTNSKPILKDLLIIIQYSIYNLHLLQNLHNLTSAPVYLITFACSLSFISIMDSYHL